MKRIGTTRLGLGAALSILLLAAHGGEAQTLDGQWGSPLYGVQLAVAGSAVTGRFTLLAEEQAPPGSLVGQRRADGLAFTATWTMRAGPDTAAFSTWLVLSTTGDLLRGYRWSEGTQPAAFSLRRVVDAAAPVAVEHGASQPGPATPPATTELPPGEPDEHLLACTQNLQMLVVAMMLYAQQHDHRLPDASQWMDQIQPYLTNEGRHRCPKAPQLRYAFAMNAAFSRAVFPSAAELRSTILVFESNLGTRNAASGLAAVARPPRHKAGSLCVSADGHVAVLAGQPGQPGHQP